MRKCGISVSKDASKKEVLDKFKSLPKKKQTEVRKEYNKLKKADAKKAKDEARRLEEAALKEKREAAERERQEFLNNQLETTQATEETTGTSTQQSEEQTTDTAQQQGSRTQAGSSQSENDSQMVELGTGNRRKGSKIVDGAEETLRRYGKKQHSNDISRFRHDEFNRRFNPVDTTQNKIQDNIAKSDKGSKMHQDATKNTALQKQNYIKKRRKHENELADKVKENKDDINNRLFGEKNKPDADNALTNNNGISSNNPSNSNLDLSISSKEAPDALAGIKENGDKSSNPPEQVDADKETVPAKETIQAAKQTKTEYIADLKEASKTFIEQNLDVIAYDELPTNIKQCFETVKEYKEFKGSGLTISEFQRRKDLIRSNFLGAIEDIINFVTSMESLKPKVFSQLDTLDNKTTCEVYVECSQKVRLFMNEYGYMSTPKLLSFAEQHPEIINHADISVEQMIQEMQEQEAQQEIV